MARWKSAPSPSPLLPQRDMLATQKTFFIKQNIRRQVHHGFLPDTAIAIIGTPDRRNIP